MARDGENSGRPRVLLADDSTPLLDAEAALLRPFFEIVGTVRDGAALVSEAVRLNPDLIVADISMPVTSGIDAARKLRLTGSSAKLVFLSVHREEEFVNACFSEGAAAYVHKSCMKNHLVPALRAAIAGQKYISPLAVRGS